MREPVEAAPRSPALPGTEVYRAANAFESGIVAVADQVGLHAEAANGYRTTSKCRSPTATGTTPRDGVT